MSKKIQETPNVELKQCYKFIENVLIGSQLHKEGDCIKLLKEDLGLYGPYVKKCHGEKTEQSAGPCIKC